MGFIEVIFITILVFWALGYIGRLLLRWWLLKKQRQFAEQFGQRQPGGQRSRGAGARRQTKKEGEVSVQQTARQEKKVSGSVGDYVEFEEVEIIDETRTE